MAEALIEEAGLAALLRAYYGGAPEEDPDDGALREIALALAGGTSPPIDARSNVAEILAILREVDDAPNVARIEHRLWTRWVPIALAASISLFGVWNLIERPPDLVPKGTSDAFLVA